MKLLWMISDLGGCKTYRVDIPATELRQFGVQSTIIPWLPSHPTKHTMQSMVELISGYDIVIVQRTYDLDMVTHIRKACNLLGIPMVYETDDNYLDLEPHNPAYLAMIPRNIDKSEMTLDELKELIEPARERYRQIIKMADLVTVTTEELKYALYPYNKNIEVLPNNVLDVYKHRPYESENEHIRDGKLVVEKNPETNMVSIPSYYYDPTQQKLYHTPRLGYSGTFSHQGPDWETVEHAWYKIITKYSGKKKSKPKEAYEFEPSCWFVYIGDPFFYDKNMTHTQNKKLRKRCFWIEPAEYSMYTYNLRNLDIGIAPLAMLGPFNMSKSDIKAVELAAYGIPCVLPHWITYSRTFVHEETCLFYENSKQFAEACERLIRDPKLRQRLGYNAMKYVEENRLERLPQNSRRRYDILKSLLDKSYRLKIFHPVR